MREQGHVVFLGKLGEGGGLALLVKPELADVKEWKTELKVAGTLTGLQ